MELHRIRGGSKKELESRSYNIGVGISLGNKWFTPENILELVKWSLKYTHENVIVYVADSIHAINEEVRGKMSRERAMVRSLRKGEEIISTVRTLIELHLSHEEQERIVYVFWNDIVDSEYQKKTTYLIDLFFSSSDFSNCIKRIVSNSVSKEERVFTQEEITNLAMYIIHELPEVLIRVPMKNYICDAYVYPFDGELSKLAEQIQEGEIFPEIKERILDTKPKVFLEVR